MQNSFSFPNPVVVYDASPVDDPNAYQGAIVLRFGNSRVFCFLSNKLPLINLVRIKRIPSIALGVAFRAAILYVNQQMKCVSISKIILENISIVVCIPVVSSFPLFLKI